MMMANSGSADVAKLGTQFDELRKKLSREEFSDRRDKPLQYWVLPSDRRLPIALLDRKVGDLVSTSFDELSATPGIGQKKIRSLVKLLDRATLEGPPQADLAPEALPQGEVTSAAGSQPSTQGNRPSGEQAERETVKQPASGQPITSPPVASASRRHSESDPLAARDVPVSGQSVVPPRGAARQRRMDTGHASPGAGSHSQPHARRSMSSAAATFNVRFDPNLVSEALWSQWCSTISKFSIGDETLGRLAPSLEQLPTVIWNTPLSHYIDLSIAEIRGLRTHGEKRVRCVLEVAHSVYHRLKHAPLDVDLYQLLTPPWVQQLQAWSADRLSRQEMPTAQEVDQGFVRPLMEMIEVDCGPTVSRLIRQRLGIGGEPPQSVREQAKALGVTRARVYQLLDDCGKVMAVRWPDGLEQLDVLMSHLTSLDTDHSPLRLFFALRELCFPERQDSTSTGQRRERRQAFNTEPRANAGSRQVGERYSDAGSHRSSAPKKNPDATLPPRASLPARQWNSDIEQVSLRPSQPGAHVTRQSSGDKDSTNAGTPDSPPPNSPRDN